MKNILHRITTRFWLIGLILRRRFAPSSRRYKADLLRGLQLERQALEDAILPLDETKRLIPLLPGAWSVKDLLAHIAEWDKRGLGWIRCAAAGCLPDMPLPGYTWSDFDWLNLRTYLENRGRPLIEVETWFREAYVELIEAIEALPDGQVERPLTAELVRWRGKHYHSHRAELELALAAGRSPA